MIEGSFSMTRSRFTQEPSLIVLLSYSRWGDGKSTAIPNFYFSFLFQLPNPLLQELPLWFLLGQGQSLLIRGLSLSGPAQPAVHIGTS